MIVAPYSTEKTLMLIDKENSIQFKVSSDATKKDIKRDVERMFDVGVEKVNVRWGRKGKMAIVKLVPKDSAGDLATRLGVI